MHKAEYELIAKTIHNLPWADQIRAITAARFARALQPADPQFDKDLFMGNCGFAPVPGRKNVYRRNDHFVQAS